MRVSLVLAAILLAVTVSSGRRSGGGRSGGGRSSFGSRVRAALGGRRSSSSNSRSASYPKQQWGSSSGGAGGAGSYPKQQWGGGSPGGSSNIGGGGFVKPGSNNGGSFGGGFAQPRPSYGSGSYGSKGALGGLGALGALGAAKSFKSPGYGTNFGTKFTGGTGKYGGKGFSKKALGLGVGAGFLGGAALGTAGAVASMGVYHRYWEFKRMLYMNSHNGNDWNNAYYRQNYLGGSCFGGCYGNSFCRFGFCECLPGFNKFFGSCYPNGQNPNRPAVDPFGQCQNNQDCQRTDINLVCNTNITVQAGGRCECRETMKWNDATLECQFYLDVDCSKITYETPASPVVLAAANKTLDEIKLNNITAPELSDNSTTAANETLTVNQTLSTSLLSSIDPVSSTKDELTEAFCRDIDTFSWEFAQPRRQNRDNINRGAAVAGSVIAGAVAAVVIGLLCCCCCVGCCCCGGMKAAKSCFGSKKDEDEVHDEQPMQYNKSADSVNPGYQGGEVPPVYPPEAYQGQQQPYQGYPNQPYPPPDQSYPQYNQPYPANPNLPYPSNPNLPYPQGNPPPYAS